MQMLRGLACILVILLHVTGTFYETYHYYFLGNIFKFGGSGVDIFFVLSGFIITYSNKQYIGKAAGIGKFLQKRIIRIFPIYWIIISFFLALQLLLPSFYRTHFQLNFANLLNTYLLLPNHQMVNGVSWSLTNELFFYFLFTLALLIPQKRYTLLLLLAYLIFLLVLPATSLNNTSGIIYKDNGFAGLFIFPMNIEFLLGILVVLFVEQFPKKWCTPFLFTGIGLFIISATLYNYDIFFLKNGYNRVLFFGFTAFLIILALVKYEFVFNIKVNSLFLKLGDASYSIYLFHLPIVAAFFKIIVKLPVTNHLLLVLLCCGLLSSICILGIMIYKVIESPLIKWLNKKLI
jgi:exopolysaccharide production protein ExoZ